MAETQLNIGGVWQKARQAVTPLFLGALFFFVLSYCHSSTIRTTATVLILAVLTTVLLCFQELQKRFTAIILALALVVLMDGISIAYAVSGKLALTEFLKPLASFLIVLLLLAFAPEQESGRWVASVLAVCSAVMGIVSIDMLSTHWISDPVLAFLSRISSEYLEMSGVEAGVRMTSLYDVPNVFAGCVGIGVLLSLGLAATARGAGRRCFHIVLLYINSLAFLLAFSMGATGAIAAAFLVYIFLDRTENRGRLLLLMLETLVITLIAAFFISQTSFLPWDGLDPIPLLCVALGSVTLCLLDTFLNQRFAPKLHGKAVLIATGGVLAAIVVFLFIAVTATGGVVLQAGDSLRRAVYPRPGSYTLACSDMPGLQVTVESQNKRETITHTRTEVYRGPVSEASFTVPEDSLVLYLTFFAEQPVSIDAVSVQGEEQIYRVPLKYKLLPSFIANRLQGLFANENAIQRFAFFEDGLKLFRRSPIWGLGMGAFESGFKSVQQFYYETKYVHNHYIQAMLDTGIIGLVLFVGLFAVSGLSIWIDHKREAPNMLTPALGALLVFMALHAAMEVVFSYFAYLPMAFGAFGVISLCCGDACPLPVGKRVRSVGVVVISVLIVFFGILLQRNSAARAIAKEKTFAAYVSAAETDPFEWADYMLSYVNKTVGEQADDKYTLRQADEFAARLAKLDSNAVPLQLARYYFYTGQAQLAFEMIEKHTSYSASDQNEWQACFDLMMWYEEDTPEFRAGVDRIGQRLENWNANNIGGVSLTAKEQEFLQRMRS